MILDTDMLRLAEKLCLGATAIFRTIETLTPDDRQAAVEIIKAYERDVLRETTWRPRPR